jgi:hypothetical protein
VSRISVLDRRLIAVGSYGRATWSQKEAFGRDGESFRTAVPFVGAIQQVGPPPGNNVVWDDLVTIGVSLARSAG